MEIVIENIRNYDDLKVFATEFCEYYSKSVLKEPWTYESALSLFEYYYKNFRELIYVAYDDNKPIAIICGSIKPWCDGIHLEGGELIVLKEYRKHGVGHLLFKKAIIDAKEKYNAKVMDFVTYEDENGFPFSWYKSIGFEKNADLFSVTGDIDKIINNLR